MNITLQSVLARLGANFAFRIMNAARPGAQYLWATFLPERNKPDFVAKSGTMTVRTTMAGLVGLDAPYPPTGIAETSDFKEAIVKIANRVTLTEQAQRELLQLLAALGQNSTAIETAVRDTILNFVDKLIVQAHMDTTEFLRGKAMLGAIDWTFGNMRLQVDYGIPADNVLTARTGNDGYGGSASKFWTDMRLQRSALKGQVRARLAHPDTIDMIVNNDVNKVRVIAQDDVTGSFTISRLIGSAERESTDARDRITLIAYGREAEVLDPANPGKTIKVPFLPTGKVVAVGNPIPAGFQVGQGATQDPQNELPLGYTHVGPTVEGSGALGRWSDVRNPDGQPWQLEGRGVTNVLPVIEAPEKISIASTDMV